MDGLASLAAAAALFEQPSTTKRQRASTGAKRDHSTPTKKRKKIKEEDHDDISNSSNFPEQCQFNLNNDGGCDKANNNPVIQSLMRCLTPRVRMRCEFEWFYSTIDRDYFKQNEFVACLNHMGLHESSNLTKLEWSAVRSYMSSSIGRPRRFSSSFVRGELEKLESYRSQAREIQYGVGTPRSVNDFPYQVYFPVRVGDNVVVAHPHTHSLQRGLVLSLNSANAEHTDFRVQFDRADMGHLLVDDTDIAIQGEAEVLVSYERPGELDVLEQQERGACPRVGQQSAAEEGFFRGTWENCLREATEIHQSVSLDDKETKINEETPSKIGEVNNNSTVPAMTGVVSPSSTSRLPTVDVPPQDHGNAVGEIERVSIVCMACLLFLRFMSKFTMNNEKDAAVFSANTAAFMLEKIKSECASEDLELQHKLSMLFVLCQTCTKNRALGT